VPQHSTSTSQPIYPILIPLSTTSRPSLQHIFFSKFNLFDAYLMPLQPMARSHQRSLRLLRDESGDCRACSTPISSPLKVCWDRPSMFQVYARRDDWSRRQDSTNGRPHDTCSTPISTPLKVYWYRLATLKVLT